MGSNASDLDATVLPQLLIQFECTLTLQSNPGQVSDCQQADAHLDSSAGPAYLPSAP